MQTTSGWVVGVLAAVSCAVPGHPAAEESPGNRLSPVITEAEAPASTVPTVDEARERLDQIPGGTSVVDDSNLRESRAANLGDALDLVPGVYARSRFGQDETRLSIRGSGISRTFNTRGVRLLRDGLPLTEADGNTRTQLIDPMAARHIEIYRGANALEYGAASLGGAVNLVSPTGYTTDSHTLRGELGSFGYRHLQARGAWLGKERLDGLATATANQQDGFRDQSAQQALRFYGNVGVQSGQRHQTRLHLDAQNSRLELPGSLTAEEFRSDRRQAAPGYEDADASRDLNLLRAAAQHAVTLEGGDGLQLGAFLQDLRMDHPLPFAQIDSDQQDLGTALRHRTHGELWGLDNELSWGVLAVVGQGTTTQVSNFDDTEIQRDERAATVELYANNSLRVAPRTSLITGAQLVWALREIKVPTDNDAEGRRKFSAVSPRLGLLHQVTPDLQAFTNLSRSTEPPINGELIGFDDALLDAQRADTLEMGLRGRHQHFRWEAVAYHARLRDEILVFQDPENPELTAVDNADKTFHQGIELGWHLTLPLRRIVRRGHELTVSGVYNYSRFRFDGDPQWEDNAIPGLPEHATRLDVRFRHAAGFYIGPVVEAASSYFVDFANALEADAYVIYGIKAGYTSPQGWRVYLEGRNLGDRRYASNTSVVADAEVNDRVFNPGAPRSVYGGIEWQW